MDSVNILNFRIGLPLAEFLILMLIARKMKNKFFTFILLAAACQGPVKKGEEAANHDAVKTPTELERMTDWILGEWHHVSGGNHSIESWTKESDTSFTGKSWFLVGKDTALSESIRLVQRGQDILYIPLVKGQNGNKPVEFRLTDTANNQLVFENPSHDFPQKISYKLISRNYLSAKISGMQNGQMRSEEFQMIRK
jgi:hypothetical protein